MKKIQLFKNKPENWILKLVSLCLAIMLWYFVVGEDQVDINVQVPIEILNLPKHLIISNQFKRDIDVSVRGPRSMIQELRSKNITRPVNLSDAEPGTIVIKNDENSIPFPMGITVQRLQPTNITLLLDRLIQKNFTIKPITEGSPARGFALKQVKLDPDHLIISGPETILNKESSLKTYVVNVDGLDHSTSLQVHLNLEPEFSDLIGETVVTANLEVGEMMEERTITDIPVNVRTANGTVRVEPDTITVKATLPQNLISDTPELSMLFRASIVAKNITEPQKIAVNVSGVNVPGHEPIKILTVTPQEILVTPDDTPVQPDK